MVRVAEWVRRHRVVAWGIPPAMLAASLLPLTVGLTQVAADPQHPALASNLWFDLGIGVGVVGVAALVAIPVVLVLTAPKLVIEWGNGEPFDATDLLDPPADAIASAEAMMATGVPAYQVRRTGWLSIRKLVRVRNRGKSAAEDCRIRIEEGDFDIQVTLPISLPWAHTAQETCEIEGEGAAYAILVEMLTEGKVRYLTGGARRWILRSQGSRSPVVEIVVRSRNAPTVRVRLAVEGPVDTNPPTVQEVPS